LPRNENACYIFVAQTKLSKIRALPSILSEPTQFFFGKFYSDERISVNIFMTLSFSVSTLWL